MVIDPPIIKAGTAKIIGRIISSNDRNKKNIIVNVIVPHPISGEYVKYKSFVDQSGNFSMDADVETDISLIALSTSLNSEKYLLVKLTSGGVTNINVAYNSDDDVENIDITPGMNQNDMTRGFEIRNKMIAYQSDRAPQPMYDKSTDYFLNFAKNALSERLEVVNNDTLISKELREILSKDFRLLLYSTYIFDYGKFMTINYHNTNKDKSKKLDIQKIDRSYYRFLKDFKLNDPQYLIGFTFQEFQTEILQNEILKLPMIGESDVPSWLAKVKVILSDLVGFDDGPYYDVLAANAYSRQLNEEVRPLSEKQKQNIVNYWKKGEIAKILFRKNQQVVELNKFKSTTVVNDISSVSEDKVMETIVSKHKGKVIFIDLWATWCTPCLDAMQQFRSTKNEFRDKDVAFVYITNASSPRTLWEEKIKGIGSEHYYLKDAQWEYIMNHFGFEGIPSYLLYNKEGVLINKFTGFPGNEEVKKMVDGLL
ncbi:TlpA disulfide reductase family protein [Pedobacter nyackensis]|uniref:TlpA family protein disulfide reductase n=1 Tax=Pedobacter nyackensis TaxID=475255 RepID=UPI00292CB446|nr:TlpA disulfide reductase family protein [Pedobacter nyackensis]